MWTTWIDRKYSALEKKKKKSRIDSEITIMEETYGIKQQKSLPWWKHFLV